MGDFIHEHLSHRFASVADAAEARSLEEAIRRGVLGVGRPLLNPQLRA